MVAFNNLKSSFLRKKEYDDEVICDNAINDL